MKRLGRAQHRAGQHMLARLKLRLQRGQKRPRGHEVGVGLGLKDNRLIVSLQRAYGARAPWRDDRSSVRIRAAVTVILFTAGDSEAALRRIERTLGNNPVNAQVPFAEGMDLCCCDAISSG